MASLSGWPFVVSLRSPPEAMEQASPPCGPPPLGSTSSVLPRLLALAAAKAPPWNLLSRFARQLAVSLRSTAARFAGLLTGLFHSRITCVMRSFHSLVDRLLTLFALHYAPLYYASTLTHTEIVRANQDARLCSRLAVASYRTWSCSAYIILI